jgi:hypothetical protein
MAAVLLRNGSCFEKIVTGIDTLNGKVLIIEI